MPTIRLTKKVKEKLEKRMEQEIRRQAQGNPTIFLQALKQKQGYTHSEYIDKLLEERK